MNKKVDWGVLGVADIALKRVISAMQHGECSQVMAIASRDLKKAQQAAEQLSIRKAYGSYEELLTNPDHQGCRSWKTCPLRETRQWVRAEYGNSALTQKLKLLALPTDQASGAKR